MIEITAEQLERIELLLQEVPKGAERAVRSIISQAQKVGRKRIYTAITTVYDIEESELKKRRNTRIYLRTRKMDSGIVGEIKIFSNKIPLHKFGAKPQSPKAMPHRVPVIINDKWVMMRPGITPFARQMKSRPFQRFDDAFVAKMPNGHEGIFERKHIRTSEVTEIMGNSVSQMVEHLEVMEQIEDAVMETIHKRIEPVITHILNGHGGR